MSKKTRILALLLALVMSVMMFAACDTSKNGDDTEATSEQVTPSDTVKPTDSEKPTDSNTEAPTETPTGSQTELATEVPTDTVTEQPPVIVTPDSITIKLVDGKVNFKVIRPDALTAQDVPVVVAQSIRSKLTSLFGVEAGIGNDFIKKGTSHDASTLEILVGLTNYDETADAVKTCDYGEYSIKAVGNKIVITAYTDSCISEAGATFNALLSKNFNKDTKEITIKTEDLNREVKRDLQLSALPMYESGTFYSYYDAGERVSGAQCDEIIIKNTTPEEYKAYLAKLEANGYTKYTDNEITDNLFATYTNSSYTVNAGFYKYENSARILIEPKAPAVGLESDNVYTPITTSQITMLGLEIKSGDEYTSNGLSMLIRLTDGRFIVVDGGFNRSDCCSQLIKTMKDQAKAYTNKPVVAAWIVTHAHGDHNGMINGQYTAIKNAGISVQSFMLSFMSDYERDRAANANLWSGEGGNYKTTWAAATAFSATVYKLHVGQVFYIADAKLEILYTLESFAPKITNAFNTTSNVIKMTFGGKTTYMSTGDATGNGFQICSKMYGTYLQSDIIQVSHHGYTTWGNDAGTISAYNNINASLVLWPQGIVAFPNYKDKAYNAVLFNQKNYKEYYVAGSQGTVTTVELPYEYGVSKITVTTAN